MQLVLQAFLGTLLVLAAAGMLVVKRPMHAALLFLSTLLLLAALYLQLAAEFVAIIQILVYAGAILVLFVFVMMLFQNAALEKAGSQRPLILFGVSAISLALLFVVRSLSGLLSSAPVEQGSLFGSVEEVGKALYLEFFFPFEAVVLLLLVGMIGAVYIGKKEKE